MASKNLINSPSTCVDDCLKGLVAVSPALNILQGHKVIVRSDIEKVKANGKVTLISGGGSGHEPSHAGFVGQGMLSAAVAGAVFTSPPPASILAAIKAVNGPGGTLLIVKNYTGDRLNFGLAAEQAKNLGMKVEMVVVAEDCALTSADRTAGRRGLCGTVFMHKIAGALAEEGRSLEEIVVLCKKAASSMGTIGLSLSACCVPGCQPSFKLNEDEMELGLGIHGEAGVRRMKMTSAKEAVNVMLKHMTNTNSDTHLPLQKGDEVALIVNNLGGTSVLEMNIFANEAILWLEQNGVNVPRVYVGSFMTSLKMAGVSLTLLHLDGDVRRDYLDAATLAPAWLPSYLRCSDRSTPKEMPSASVSTQIEVQGVEIPSDLAAKIHGAITKACKDLIENEDVLNDLDRASGDADCGTTHTRGARAILNLIGASDNLCAHLKYPQSLLLSIASVISNDMGGSSGALYSLFFTAAAAALSQTTDAAAWVNALSEGISAIMRYGGAQIGDRTMLDALKPALDKLSTPSLSALEAAAQAAMKGAESTRSMKAHAGRASYVADDQLTMPDPGAHAAAIWISAVSSAFS